MKHLKKFNENWEYNPNKVPDHKLAEEIATDLIKRPEINTMTSDDFDNYMKERGCNIALSDLVRSLLVEWGINFSTQSDDDADLEDTFY